MKWRVPWLLGCVCSAIVADAHAATHPQIDFQPESGRFNAATEEYREIWRTEGERISATLEQATGLEMEPGPIKAIAIVRQIAIVPTARLRIQQGHLDI